MTERADAFVFFGATGDLARKMIFPALHQLVAAGRLDIPVIGVAFSGWDVDRLRHRVRESVTEAGGDHRSALEGLLSLVRYVKTRRLPTIPPRSRPSGPSSVARGTRYTTWPSRPSCSPPSSGDWERAGVHAAGGWSWRSPSATTSRAPKS